MTDKLIINTAGEEMALIPDKWVIGSGMTTNNHYIMHTNAPLLIIKYPEHNENKSCIVYVNGDVSPSSLNHLFAEGWQLLENYRRRIIKNLI